MSILLNSFPADISPVEVVLPYLDFATWEESTSAKENHFPRSSTWRYEMDQKEAEDSTKRYRVLFLAGPPAPTEAKTVVVDVGRFWRIGCLLIEGALATHFEMRGFAIEESHFERLALRRVSSPDDAVELATGVSFSARRPFRDERYRFTLSFQWIVRALFRDTLTNEPLAGIALGMAVLYKPSGPIPTDLRQFTNRYLGRVRDIDRARSLAIVMCRDDQPRSVPLVDLRLEASPAVIKVYEQRVRSRVGPSTIIRSIQQLKMSLTSDNRRNLMALRDRMDQTRRVLFEVGSSHDQLVIPLVSFQPGSVSISLSPVEATLGEIW